MQKFGYVSDEGTIGHWVKSEGDPVVAGEVLVEIETEKAIAELTAPVSGILFKILVAEGTTVKIGKPIAIITESREEVPDIEAIMKEPAISRSEAKIEVTAEIAPEREEAGKPIMASPAARRMASEYEVDLGKVQGRGPDGSVTRDDVAAFIEKNKNEEVIPLSGFKKAMAERLTYSVRTYAHVTTTWEIDLTNLLELRNSLKPEWAEQGTAVTVTSFLIRAVALALKDVPMLNSSLDNGKIIVKKYYNIGIATSVKGSGEGSEDKLVIPVVKNADKKNLIEIAQDLENLVDKARSGSLTHDDISGGTFTISNTGPLGGAGVFTSIINPPESAILGMGSGVEKPVVRDGKIVIRSIVPLCLTYDHRIILPTQSAKFRLRCKELLENPRTLL
jgi:pyruvate/2-oxoglutarate dehydrogenase complex dihydrolipoamide acyltransferase (E2) component